MTATIGSTLKEARTKKSISLEDVHSRIKIHPRVLQLLEEDKFDKLPSPLFAKSFLKSYAAFLEIDAEALVQQYEKEKTSQPEQALYIKPADAVSAPALSPAAITGAVLAALFLFFVLSGEPTKLVKHWSAKLRSAKWSVEKSPKNAPKAKEEAPKEILKLAEEPSEWLNSVSLGNFPKIKSKTPLSLEIKALDAVWVHITTDGAVIFQGILKKGASEQWSAKDSVEVWTGNASNMALTLNKYSLGSPGKGVVKKMIISREGIRIVTPA
jgi:cytoskeletal protein RodZ